MVRHGAIALALTEGDRLLLNVLDMERWRSMCVTGASPWSLQDLFWDDSGTIWQFAVNYQTCWASDWTVKKSCVIRSERTFFSAGGVQGAPAKSVWCIEVKWARSPAMLHFNWKRVQKAGVMGVVFLPHLEWRVPESFSTCYIRFVKACISVNLYCSNSSVSKCFCREMRKKRVSC